MLKNAKGNISLKIAIIIAITVIFIIYAGIKLFESLKRTVASSADTTEITY